MLEIEETYLIIQSISLSRQDISQLYICLVWIITSQCSNTVKLFAWKTDAFGWLSDISDSELVDHCLPSFLASCHIQYSYLWQHFSILHNLGRFPYCVLLWMFFLVFSLEIALAVRRPWKRIIWHVHKTEFFSGMSCYQQRRAQKHIAYFSSIIFLSHSHAFVNFNMQ